MRYDAFSKCHPLTSFLFFAGAIVFSAVIQHPAYLTASCVGAASCYLLLNGRKGRKLILGMIPSLMAKAKQLSGARKSVGKGVGEQSTNKEGVTDGMNILAALTDWALEGSIVTADSMESCGYGAAKRTSLQIYRLTGRDVVSLYQKKLEG